MFLCCLYSFNFFSASDIIYEFPSMGNKDLDLLQPLPAPYILLPCILVL